MTKLTESQRKTLALVERSKKENNNKIFVSSICWNLIKDIPDELLKKEQLEDGSGGYVIVTTELEILFKWIKF